MIVLDDSEEKDCDLQQASDLKRIDLKIMVGFLSSCRNPNCIHLLISVEVSKKLPTAS